MFRDRTQYNYIGLYNCDSALKPHILIGCPSGRSSSFLSTWHLRCVFTRSIARTFGYGTLWNGLDKV